MFARHKNMAIVKVQKLTTQKFGNTLHTAHIVQTFERETNRINTVRELDTLTEKFIKAYGL